MPPELPKISVITPSYNQGEFLEETIQSVLNQRYPNLEYIVIDGGSTDDSVDIIRRYESRLAYWISEPDSGQCEAINKGFAQATGDILCFLNSDDVYVPGALNIVAAQFTRYPELNWLSAPSLRFMEQGTILEGKHQIKDDPVHWLLACRLAQPSTFWRKKLYDELGGLDPNFHFALDYELWLRMIFAGYRVKFIDRPLSGYRYHENSKTVSMQERFRQEEQKLYDRYVPKLSKRDQRRFWRARRARIRNEKYWAALAALREGDPARARDLLTEAIRNDPANLLNKSALATAVRVWLARP